MADEKMRYAFSERLVAGGPPAVALICDDKDSPNWPYPEGLEDGQQAADPIVGILNDPRPYGYEPDPDNPMTLTRLKTLADGYTLNGPEGNEYVLRLLEIIDLLRASAG